MRKNVFTFLVIITILVFTLSFTAFAEDIGFGGSSHGGGYYYMVGAMSELSQDKLDDINITNVATGASAENVQKVMTKELDFGLAHAAHVEMGRNHEGDRYSQIGEGGEDLRGIAYVYPAMHYFVTLEKTGITTLSELEGETVSMGQPGSGAQFESRTILNMLDINVDQRFLQFSDAKDAVKEGRITAFGVSGGPTGAVVELCETDDVVIIPYTEKELEILTAGPFVEDEMPEGFYADVEEPIKMPSFPALWIGHKDVSEDTVYKILEMTYEPENLTSLAEAKIEWETIQPGIDIFENMDVPMHEGAKKFYEEYQDEYDFEL